MLLRVNCDNVGRPSRTRADRSFGRHICQSHCGSGTSQDGLIALSQPHYRRPHHTVQESTARSPGRSQSGGEVRTSFACLSLPSTQQGEIQNLREELGRLFRTTAPALVEAFGVGPDSAAALLVAAGSNADRLRSEASFASLCGVNPIPASSGKTNRHRLNRVGGRQASAALYRIVVIRLRYEQRTQAYMRRRTEEGVSKTEVIR